MDVVLKVFLLLIPRLFMHTNSQKSLHNNINFHPLSFNKIHKNLNFSLLSKFRIFKRHTTNSTRGLINSSKIFLKVLHKCLIRGNISSKTKTEFNPRTTWTHWEKFLQHFQPNQWNSKYNKIANLRLKTFINYLDLFKLPKAIVHQGWKISILNFKLFKWCKDKIGFINPRASQYYS